MKLKHLNLTIVLIFIILLTSCGKKEYQFELIPVKIGKDWGYINKKDSFAIKPQFKQAQNFIDGLALVQTKDNKYSFINKNGQVAFKAQYKSALGFSEGLACVVPEDGKPQYIDNKGKPLFSVDADNGGSFHNGIAMIRVKKKYGFINKHGEVIIQPKYDEAKDFSEGRAAVCLAGNSTDKDKWGYINEEGKMSILPSFEKAYAFINGFAVVLDKGKYGYINKAGKYAITPRFESASAFANGLAMVKQNGLYGYIDKSGSFVIKPSFMAAYDFSANNTAAVMDSSGKMGYINKEGKYIILPQFDNCYSFIGDIAFAEVDHKIGVINATGTYLIKPRFVSVYVKDITPDQYGIQSELIRSNYLDMAALMATLMKGTDKENLIEYSGNTTLGNILKIYPGIDTMELLKKKDNVLALRDQDYGENISLVNRYMGLSDFIVKKKRGFKSGMMYLIPGSESLSRDIYLKAMTCHFWLKGSAAGKEVRIFEELKKQLISKCGFRLFNNKDQRINIPIGEDDNKKVKSVRLINDKMTCHLCIDKEGLSLRIFYGYDSNDMIIYVYNSGNSKVETYMKMFNEMTCLMPTGPSAWQ